MSNHKDEEMLMFQSQGAIKEKNHGDDHEPKKNHTLQLSINETMLNSEKRGAHESNNARGKERNIRVRPYIKSKESGILNLQEAKPYKIKKEIADKYKETSDKLEEMRRKTESQDTRLLKIQNEARHIEKDYMDKKHEVERKLVELSKRTQEFIEAQRNATDTLNKQEEQVKKDEYKRKAEEDKYKANEQYNRLKKEENDKREAEIKQKEEELKLIKQRVDDYKKYEDFLREVMKRSPEFNDLSTEKKETKEEKDVMEIINKQRKIKENKRDKEKEVQEAESKSTQIKDEFNEYKKKTEDETHENNIKIHDFKNKKEELDEKIAEIDDRIEKKQKDTSEKVAKWGKIMLAIKNLYIRVQDFKHEKKKEKDAANSNNPNNLNLIEEESKEKAIKNDYSSNWTKMSTDDLIGNLITVKEVLLDLKCLKKKFLQKKE